MHISQSAYNTEIYMKYQAWFSFSLLEAHSDRSQTIVLNVTISTLPYGKQSPFYKVHAGYNGSFSQGIVNKNRGMISQELLK